jgi:DNA-binding IclR family transcriptional regulator
VRDSSQYAAGDDLHARDREVAHLSLNFVLDMASRGIAGLKPLECLLLMAINQANIAPLTRDPAARSRYGALEAPAPDAERRPVSVRAVAASMQLPYETARRNIRGLEARGVCVVTEAGVVVPTAFMLSPHYLEAAQSGHERLYVLYRMLRARRLLEPLPVPHYDEDEPPVRGAVRLMSDYLLRAGDAAVARTGDLVSALVVLPLVAAAAGSDAGQAPPALSFAALARRVALPSETVRRHVAALTEAGSCVSGSQGVRLADTALKTPPWRGLLRENAIAVQRLYAGLAERGVVAAWERLEGNGDGGHRAEGAA